MARVAEAHRVTKETEVTLRVDLDGTGKGTIVTGVGMLDHMLELVKVHAGLDLSITATGDTQVDFHHTVEDVAIVLGGALLAALGDKIGIERFADRVVPMDDSVALVALDLGGRASLLYDVPVSGQIGAFDVELVEEFFRALCGNLKCNLYIKELVVGNKHHVAESIFKCFAKCLKDAVRVTGTALPSSKGRL